MWSCSVPSSEQVRLNYNGNMLLQSTPLTSELQSPVKMEMPSPYGCIVDQASCQLPPFSTALCGRDFQRLPGLDVVQPEYISLNNNSEFVNYVTSSIVGCHGFDESQTQSNVSVSEDVHRGPVIQKASEHKLDGPIYTHHHHHHHNHITSSPGGSPMHSASGAMLVVPQPISAMAKTGHASVLPNMQLNAQTGRKYNCKMCPHAFNSKADLQLHVQIHQREAKPYRCPQCHKSFANSSYLSQHARIHAGIKPYKCEVCQRRFTQLSHLQQHMRTHTGDKPYKCRHQGCTKAFTQLSNLQSHSRCHQTDKPYKCNSCYKCYCTEQELLDHIPKHKESKHLKTHICQYCGKSYTQETYLARHMQKHANERNKRLSAGATGIAIKEEPDQYTSWGAPVTTKSVGGDPQQEHLENTCGPIMPMPISHSLMHLSPNEEDVRIPQSLHREDLRHQSLHENLYDSSSGKTSSAFTPIAQSQMTSTSTGTLGPSSSLIPSISSTSRPYLSYDPISYPKAPSMNYPQMDTKHQASMFPNQLISLHQIRNYACMPNSMEHGSGVKEKSQ